MLCEHLRAEDLVLEAEGASPLRHMDFYAAAGEAVGLVGLSGAGKSLLAEVLCGEALPRQGTVRLDQTVAAPERLAQNGLLIRRSSRLLDNLTVTDNLMALGHWDGWPFSLSRHRRTCAALLRRFGMEAYLDLPVRHLPVPVHHRLLMLGAVARGKRFLALDHLSDDCTPREQHVLADFIRQLCASGVTVLYSTGRIDPILRRMDRVTVMRDGRRVKDLRLSECAEATLNTYIYGCHTDDAAYTTGGRTAGEVVLTADTHPVRAGTLTAIHDADGSAEGLLSRLVPRSQARMAVLSADELALGWLPTFSVLDNLMLGVARRMSGPFFHVSQSVCRMLRQECAAETGLTEAQIDAHYARLTRTERFRLLLYREGLRRPDIWVFDRITAGSDFRDRENMLGCIADLPGTVLYLSSDHAELERFGVRILSLWDGRLEKEAP